MNKVIVRIKGGLGNQLFSYAAARRLATVNCCDLVIDDVTGFARDYKYQRQYSLDHFCISARKATSVERLEPFERYRRGVMKWRSRTKAFAERSYLEQETQKFDERLLAFKVTKDLYLEGYWQSEEYFKDVEADIRRDLRIIPPTDPMNLRMSEEIRNADSVALHVRWFDPPGTTANSNVSSGYYFRAIALLEKTIRSPHYFLFSDDPDAARATLLLAGKRVTVVNHNIGDRDAFVDLWLMTQCRYFITANSTFSWWGAWLAGDTAKMVIAPALKSFTASADDHRTIPKSWSKLEI